MVGGQRIFPRQTLTNSHQMIYSFHDMKPPLLCSNVVNQNMKNAVFCDILVLIQGRHCIVICLSLVLGMLSFQALPPRIGHSPYSLPFSFLAHFSVSRSLASELAALEEREHTPAELLVCGRFSLIAIQLQIESSGSSSTAFYHKWDQQAAHVSHLAGHRQQDIGGADQDEE